MVARIRSVAPRNKHDPKVLPQIMLMLAHNFPQTAPDTIANYGVPEPTRSNEPETARAAILDGCRTKRQEFATPHQAVSFYALVFGRVRQAASF